jgi:signal transduction histidine kinase/CheY-like chemotaxis protein
MKLGPTLHSISQLLESADGANERVLRCLGLLRELVPYEQCALLEARPGEPPHVLVIPATPPYDLDRLTDTLLAFFGRLVDTSSRTRLGAAQPNGAHLVVPLVGLDEVIGLIYVRSSERPYTELHLHALSLVAASLAAYFIMLRGRAELAEVARERDEARRLAEAANCAKDEFLALVSDELKAPLGPILASAQILRSSKADDAARAQAAEALTRNVHAQSKLIDDILDLSCVATARLRLNLQVVAPAEVIKESLEGLRLLARRKAIQLDSIVDKEAPPLVADADRLNQVVSTLVASAIEFSPPGGHVEVRLERADSYARIQVKDSGKGISREALPHIFDAFPRGEGTGMGTNRAPSVELATVKYLVELHGGRVRAESAGPGSGSTFTVELPRASSRGVPPSGAHTSDRLLTGVRVLLVEHDDDVRAAFQAVLEQYGAEITAVPSAPAALTAMEGLRPDVLVFGDLAMPNGGADDLMRELESRSWPVPTVSISALKVDDRGRLSKASFQKHLEKPVGIEGLVQAVAELAGRMPDNVPTRARD